jgi:hypothetical protein
MHLWRAVESKPKLVWNLSLVALCMHLWMDEFFARFKSRKRINGQHCDDIVEE